MIKGTIKKNDIGYPCDTCGKNVDIGQGVILKLKIKTLYLCDNCRIEISKLLTQ